MNIRKMLSRIPTILVFISLLVLTTTHANAEITYKDYADLTNSTPFTSACCPEVSVAENDETVILTGNSWMALSTDGGANFTNINPTTIFPQSDGGFCCDQVVEYVPTIDMFVWLLQYRKKGGANRLRLAAQTTEDVRRSGGTAWTYWDFLSSVFETSGILDYNDMSWGDNNLYISTSLNGRNVLRLPLRAIAAKRRINFQWADSTKATWSHVTHNARDTVYWAHHLSNSELRVYSMRDSDDFYSWRTVDINSWPNGNNKSIAPDGTDWMRFENSGSSGKHYVFGNALQGNDVWFGWLAAAGGGFPEPHVQLVKIDPSDWILKQQGQVWNEKIAFLDPYLSTNAKDELGMAISFGGPGAYPTHAVGIWGDFIVYYPRLGTRATNRWGDYSTCRRSTSNPLEWVAGGYTQETNSRGNNINTPHYIRFGR